MAEEGAPLEEILDNPDETRPTLAVFPVSSCDLSLYSAEIAVGTPAQVFDVLMDTAASGLWVLSSCESCPDYDDARTYDESMSETYEGEDLEGAGSGFVSMKG